MWEREQAGLPFRREVWWKPITGDGRGETVLERGLAEHKVVRMCVEAGKT